jgi:hypothetical protein
MKKVRPPASCQFLAAASTIPNLAEAKPSMVKK